MKRAVLILIVIALALGIGAVIFLKAAARGFSAREEPTAIEKFIARAARNMAIPAKAKLRQNPTPNTHEVLAEAREHWAAHCATCHANDGSGTAEMGHNMYPPAPDMRNAETQNLTDGELFYIIENGVRLTGMPAWGTGTPESEQDSWKLVRFIRHLPQVSTEEEREMRKMNPKTPAELQEEKEVDEFLKGGDPNVKKRGHSH